MPAQNMFPTMMKGFRIAYSIFSIAKQIQTFSLAAPNITYSDLPRLHVYTGKASIVCLLMHPLLPVLLDVHAHSPWLPYLLKMMLRSVV